MCLILFAWKKHAKYSLVVAANRDEFYSRPTQQINWWSEAPYVLAGKDYSEVLGMPGTWMGLSRHGKFAALTNVREHSTKNTMLRTRGEIVSKYLTSDVSPIDFFEKNKFNITNYNGFNLLFGELSDPDNQNLFWISNRLLTDDGLIAPNENIKLINISSGIYGLSNAMLNTEWPKVKNMRTEFSIILNQDTGEFNNSDSYFRILGNTVIANDASLPYTGVSVEWERLLSSAFIQTQDYGTRSSTLLRISNNGKFEAIEKSFNQNGEFSSRKFISELI